MKKFIKTFLFGLGLLFYTTTLTPNPTDDTLLNMMLLETSEARHLREHYNIVITEKYNINQYPSISPLSPRDITHISSHFGERIHPIYHKPFHHTGVDLAAPEGAVVLATANGIVVNAGRKGGYGNQIIIDHGNDYTTRYAHLSKILVNIGDTVTVGGIIGQVGSTGISTGNHLHYELIHHNECIDPMSIYPDTLQGKQYLAYLRKVNDQFLSCSDTMFNI